MAFTEGLLQRICSLNGSISVELRPQRQKAFERVKNATPAFPISWVFKEQVDGYLVHLYVYEELGFAVVVLVNGEFLEVFEQYDRAHLPNAHFASVHVQRDLVEKAEDVLLFTVHNILHLPITQEGYPASLPAQSFSKGSPALELKLLRGTKGLG